MNSRALAPAAASFVALCVSCAAHAQSCTPSWPVTFPPLMPLTEYGGPGIVSSAVVFDDDGPGPDLPALYVRGSFRSIGGVPAQDIAKWDGVRWSALPLSLATVGPTSMVAYDAVGNGVPFLYTIGGSIAGGGNDIYRWNGVSWWPAASNSLYYSVNGQGWQGHGQGFGQPVRLFAMDPDGPGPEPVTLFAAQDETYMTFYGGGFYSEYHRFGTLHKLVAGSWTPIVHTGQVLDLTTFDDDGPGPDNPTLYAVTQSYDEYDQPGGQQWTYSSTILKLIGGQWQTIIAQTQSDLVGNFGFTSLASFDPDGAGPQPAHLYVGGTFTLPGSSNIVHLAVVGDQVTPIASDADGNITSLFVLDQSGAGSAHPALYAVGDFTHIGGIAAAGIARFDGAVWSALGPGIPAGAAHPIDFPWISSLVVFDDDGAAGPRQPFLYAGGSFTNAGYAHARGLARWDDLSWLPPGNYVDNPVHALLSADDGSGPALYVGGEFLSSAGLRTVGISRWDGTSFSQMTEGMDNHVDALALFQNHVVAAGKFTNAGGVLCNRIARWSGSAWQPLASGLNDNAAALAVHNGSLYAGGAFTAAGGASAAHIARWSGSSWSPLGAGVDGPVTALAVNGGSLFVGGDFSHAGGLGAARVAGWDGAAWRGLAGGPPSTVTALATHRGLLYAGGVSLGDTSTALVSAWTGESWFTLPPLSGTGAVRLTAMYSFDEDGSGSGQPVLYVSGDFDHSGSTPLPHLARWDGLSWSAPVSALDAPALAFAPFGGTAAAPTLYAGGEFSAAGGAPSWFMASLSGCPLTCEANCDGSTSPPLLNISDFTCYLQKFAAGNPYANCDGSTAVPIFNVQDFTCFLQKFAAGCP